jgi:NAD(P)H-flavin reductase
MSEAELKPKGRLIYKMRVAKIIDYTPTIRELFLELLEPTNFQFKAGQFVMLHVPQEGSAKAALRAYSIASTHHRQNGFQLIFKYVENGLASKFVWGLEEGATVHFTGPFGKVFFKEPPTEQIVFLNTGSGVAQHLAFLLSHAADYPDIRYRLFFGVRNENDIYYEKQLQEMKIKWPNFEYEYILSRPSEKWSGRKGYVHHFLEELDYSKIPTTFYLCGNGQMIKDVKKLLIEEKNFPPTHILSEAFD